MRKDRFGICLSFYAVIAFIFTILGQSTLGALLLGFVILVQQDEWLTRQVMQAFLLNLFYLILSTVLDLFHFLYNIPLLGAAVSSVIGLVESVIWLVLLVFALIGLLNVAKGKDANVPGCKGYTDKAFGLIKTVTYSQAAPQPQNPQNPQNPQ